MRPLILIREGAGVESLVLESLVRIGWTVHRGWPPETAWGTDEQGVVYAAPIEAGDDFTNAVLAVARGAGLVAWEVGHRWTCRLYEDLTRFGPVAVFHPTASARTVARLSSEQIELVHLLADGKRLDAAAAAVHVSRRTANRRLRDARATLGARTTAEAVAAVCAAERDVRDMLETQARVSSGVRVLA